MSISNDKINELISKMSLREKVGQLNQHLYGWQCFEKKSDGQYILTNYFKEHVKKYGGVGAIYGILRADTWSGMNEVKGIKKEDSLKVVQMIQDYIQENTRLKIPALISEECVHGHMGLHSMMYPANISMGMTWNPELLKNICEAVSEELASKGGHLALYAGLDIMRDPRWGRSEECYSEDSYLSVEMVKNAVSGFQNNTNGVGVVLKHLCAQGACVGGHNSGAASIGPRELREIFLPVVESGVLAGAKGVMAAYNEIDGIPCHVNKHLLTTILREQYHFNGIVMADGCALDRLLIMNPNAPKMAAKAIKAGVDLSLWDDVYTQLEASVQDNYVGEDIINKSVERVLRVKYELGLFEKTEKKLPSFNQQQLALQAARECQVLLKNNGILPLDKQFKKIAVIGPNANNAVSILGDYSSFQKEEDVITIYKGIQNIVGNKCIVNYAKGCAIRNSSYKDMAEAITLAKESDVVILALGGSSARNFKMEFENNGAVKTSYDKLEMNCGENVDMANLDLDGIQVELLQKIKEVNNNVITVLIQGRPHSIGNIIEDSSAILTAWYPGMLGGQAIAETIFGKNNPGGRLSVSIPRSSMQLPCYYNGKYSGAKEDYIDMPGDALYPFGYGLSFSNFEYEDIQLSKETITLEQLRQNGLNISLNVLNTSNHDGYEVIQIYIIDNESSITRRYKELKAFKKVWISKNTKKQVSIHLDESSFKIWDDEMNYIVEKGSVDILIAKNSMEYQTKKLVII